MELAMDEWEYLGINYSMIWACIRKAVTDEFFSGLSR